MDAILNINTFDAAVIGLIILLSLKGLISGFTKELFSALGIIGGLFTATFFNKDVAKYISDNLISGVNIKILELLSLVLIFIIVFLIMKLIYKMIETISNDDYISSTSRLAGMLIKIVTLFFIFSLIVYSFSSKPQVTEKFKDTLSSSSLYPLLKKSGAAILNAPALISGDSNNTPTNSAIEDNSTQESKQTEANSTNESNKTITLNKKDENNNTTKVEDNNTNITKSEDNATISNDNNTSTQEQNSTLETNSTKE